MTESATNAPDFGSSVANRIAAWLDENPQADEYCVNDELEAREILIVIAAHIKTMLGDIRNPVDRNKAKEWAAEMRRAVVQGRAIEWIRETNTDNPIQFLGVNLTVPAITVQ